jgi:hypothetical protein
MRETALPDDQVTNHSQQGPRSNGHRLSADDVLLGADSDLTPLISIVIPTLNEEQGIGECIERVILALVELQEYGEIIVSDSSTDQTPAIAHEMGAIVVTPDEPGYGYAYRYAFEHAWGEYLVMGDADTTYDFEQIPRLLAPVRSGDADMCMGSRLDGEIKPGAMPKLHQYLGNPLLTIFLNAFYDAGVSDSHSGFRVFTRDALDTMGLRTNGMEFASEMIMEAGAHDLEIAEVPIVYHPREGEANLNSFRDGWRHVRFMLLNAPTLLFTGPGVGLAGIGVLLMLVCLSGLSPGSLSFGIHTMVAGAMLTLVGAQVASLGLFAGLTSDPIRRPADPITSFITDWVNLEHGVTAGLALFGIGVAHTALSVGEWVSTGFTQLPALPLNIAALTAVVLGVQLVFSSFFFSAVADR